MLVRQEEVGSASVPRPIEFRNRACVEWRRVRIAREVVKSVRVRQQVVCRFAPPPPPSPPPRTFFDNPIRSRKNVSMLLANVFNNFNTAPHPRFLHIRLFNETYSLLGVPPYYAVAHSTAPENCRQQGRGVARSPLLNSTRILTLTVTVVGGSPHQPICHPFVYRFSPNILYSDARIGRRQRLRWRRVTNFQLLTISTNHFPEHPLSCTGQPTDVVIVIARWRRRWL